MTEFVWLADRRQRTPTVTPQQLGTSWRLPYGSYRTCPRMLPHPVPHALKLHARSNQKLRRCRL